MAAELTNILCEARGPVATVTINRPDRLNTLSVATLEELGRAVENILNQSEVRAAIITGAGEKAFAAGADISELAKLSAAEAKKFAELGQGVFNLIENGGKPFIAAVNGYAFGGGCELALACAIRIAAENARLGQPEIKLGITTGFGGSQRLARIVGKARAAELCLFGEPVDAKTALDWGLVNRVVPQARLAAESAELAGKLASYSPLALKYTLEAINTASDVPLAEGQAYEATLFGLSFGTEDMKEGTAAFLEKRKADFKGK
jgi:enoyl-CoA hydratase